MVQYRPRSSPMLLYCFAGGGSVPIYSARSLQSYLTSDVETVGAPGLQASSRFATHHTTRDLDQCSSHSLVQMPVLTWSSRGLCPHTPAPGVEPAQRVFSRQGAAGAYVHAGCVFLVSVENSLIFPRVFSNNSASHIRTQHVARWLTKSDEPWTL